MSLRASECDETHSHPAETFYFVHGGQARIHLADGSSAEVDLPDGHVMWHEPWTHRVENMGTSGIALVCGWRPLPGLFASKATAGDVLPSWQLSPST
jgi:hypothetical protein